MSTDPQTDPRVKHLRDAQRRLRSALIANADRLDKPFTDDPGKNPWDTFVRPAMRELKAAVDAIAAMPAAPVAAPPTGQAGLVLTEDERTMLAYALDQAQEKIWSEGGFTDEDQAAVTSLRRLAAETPGPETQGGRCLCGAPIEWMDVDVANGSGWIHSPGSDTPCLNAIPAGAAAPGQPRRADAFEQWLKAQRDEYEVRSSPQWGALDEVLDTYRLHADTGTPLGEHVCEGRVAGDCDCLETPATVPAVVAEPGKENSRG